MITLCATPTPRVSRMLTVYRSHSQVGRAPASERAGKISLTNMPHIEQRKLDHRLQRFDLGIRSPRSSSRSTQADNDLAFQSKPAVDENGMVDWDAITIKGTSTKLEKDYLRLTQVCAKIKPMTSVFGLPLTILLHIISIIL